MGDPIVATALLNRLLHHAVVIQIEVSSYRGRPAHPPGFMISCRNRNPSYRIHHFNPSTAALLIRLLIEPQTTPPRPAG
ncbi:ATP-binding protein [Mesorhizobium sp.]|uniref:ATP-binding protein n=1 Tax=Mesorhizobium sp. TaxID=1871066 RepID=UPI00257C4DFC|nr:ATP-binding protein [Mesorhizobium sp.]